MSRLDRGPVSGVSSRSTREESFRDDRGVVRLVYSITQVREAVMGILEFDSGGVTFVLMCGFEDGCLTSGVALALSLADLRLGVTIFSILIQDKHQ